MLYRKTGNPAKVRRMDRKHCTGFDLHIFFVTSIAGYSGHGHYHGKYGFDAFTHERGCLSRYMGLEAINCIRYPPYNQRKLDLLVSTTEVKRKGFCTLL